MCVFAAGSVTIQRTGKPSDGGGGGCVPSLVAGVSQVRLGARRTLADHQVALGVVRCRTHPRRRSRHHVYHGSRGRSVVCSTVPPPLSVWPHLFCGAGHEKRRGDQLKWSLVFRLYIGSFVFQVHSYQDQFIQPGWAECVLYLAWVCIL